MIKKEGSNYNNNKNNKNNKTKTKLNRNNKVELKVVQLHLNSFSSTLENRRFTCTNVLKLIGIERIKFTPSKFRFKLRLLFKLLNNSKEVLNYLRNTLNLDQSNQSITITNLVELCHSKYYTKVHQNDTFNLSKFISGL
ncbi:hypothetical protein ACTFIV_001501 [Dictyostelium citrinum]